MTSHTDDLTAAHPAPVEAAADAQTPLGPAPDGRTPGGPAPDGPAPDRGRRPLPRRVRSVVLPLVALAVLAWLPYVPVELPGLLPGRVNGPGSMQLLATCLVVGGIALSYDVLFGRTGLLSFGHALFVAAGSYLLTVSLSSWSLPLPLAVLCALGLSTLLAAVVGSIALRVGGIAFAMVSLAFAQAASILVLRNPGGVTGGEEGRTLDRDALPAALVGVSNAPYRYWLALGFAVVAWLVVAALVRSRAGHAMAAVRENEHRAAVLGFGTYRVRLLALVAGSALGALGGIVHALVLGGSNPHLTTSEFTLSLLVMVVLGGAGSRWGALLGGVIYTYADARLVEVSSLPVLDSLPDVVRQVLSQPLFILGVGFVVVVYFAPAGLTGLGARLLRKAGSR
ncbi:branched-chain amino acid ABC transporter permease [Terrabacter sp. NPDC000476]|uniref:branched-chain amino acid ABC transporter permease n=1 Tax=Terrabacter sp. NPDC000476 TaxID=3154258 RepID=UPI00331A10CD